jgi:hypothetical protein
MVQVAPTTTSSTDRKPLIFRQPTEETAGSANLGQPGTDTVSPSQQPPASYVQNGFNNSGAQTQQVASNSNVPNGPAEPKVAQAAAAAFKDAGSGAKGVSDGQCCTVAKKTASKLGASEDARSWQTDTSYRGKDLTTISQAISEGKLKAGDCIYMNTTPGENEDSNYTSKSGKESLPHWVTYLGGGRFGDNWSADMSLDQMVDKYKPRVIDAFCYPHGRQGASTAVA